MEKDSLKQSGYFWTLKLRCLPAVLPSSGPEQNALLLLEGWQLTVKLPPLLIKAELRRVYVLIW